MQSGAAHEGHQGGGVDRLGHAHALGVGHPDPGMVGLGPAAVVGRGEPPGGGVHPGPAVGFAPGPAAVPVGRPVGGDPGRPDGAVGLVHPPVAVAVQVLVAGHVPAHVDRALGGVLPPFPHGAPPVEPVRGPRLAHVVARLIAPGKVQGVAGIDRDRGPRRGHLGLAGAHGDLVGRAARVHIHPVDPGVVQEHGSGGGVHLHGIHVPARRQPQFHGAPGQAQLQRAAVQAQDVQAGALGQAQVGGSGVQLGDAAGADPEAVAGGQGQVDQGRGPVVQTRGLPGNGAFGVVQAHHPGGRIAPLRARVVAVHARLQRRGQGHLVIRQYDDPVRRAAEGGQEYSQDGRTMGEHAGSFSAMEAAVKEAYSNKIRS